MIAKRIFDVILALLLIILLSPVMFLAALWVRLDTPGPALFRQERIGRYGAPFTILKFRSMVVDQKEGSALVTQSSDARITRSGRVLRKLKIDELPQLVNVIRGEMSFVGPRPEVQRFVDLYPEACRRKVLSVRPGITDNASMLFRNESEILDASVDPQSEYVTRIMPKKLELYEEYVDNQSFTRDLSLILKTFISIFWRNRYSV